MIVSLVHILDSRFSGSKGNPEIRKIFLQCLIKKSVKESRACRNKTCTYCSNIVPHGYFSKWLLELKSFTFKMSPYRLDKLTSNQFSTNFPLNHSLCSRVEVIVSRLIFTVFCHQLYCQASKIIVSNFSNKLAIKNDHQRSFLCRCSPVKIK